MGKADERYLAALAFAVHAHGAVQQERKGTVFPYVVHPIRVAEVLARFKCSDEAIIAGFLHDTVEDAGVTYEQLTETFGDRVAELVEKASEADKTLDWRTRKQRKIDAL